jgi:hypothetical protein
MYLYIKHNKYRQVTHILSLQRQLNKGLHLESAQTTVNAKNCGKRTKYDNIVSWVKNSDTVAKDICVNKLSRSQKQLQTKQTNHNEQTKTLFTRAPDRTNQP